MKKGLVEGGGLLEFIPTPDGLDRSVVLRSSRNGWRPAASVSCPSPAKSRWIRLAASSCWASRAAASRWRRRPSPRTWQLPLLALDAGKLLAPYIGESERNLRDALRRVERMAPCVLWIDEIEKAFVSARILGVRRRRLQAPDRHAPDLDAGAGFESLLRRDRQRGRRAAAGDDAQGARRRGLLRGPAAAATPAPTSSGCTWRGAARTPSGSTCPLWPKPPSGFSGAEIEQAIVSALYEARAGRFPLDAEAVLVALRSTRPLSVLRAESINALRAWAAGRCVQAD